VVILPCEREQTTRGETVETPTVRRTATRWIPRRPIRDDSIFSYLKRISRIHEAMNLVGVGDKNDNVTITNCRLNDIASFPNPGKWKSECRLADFNAEYDRFRREVVVTIPLT
jgi:hypothetical protein